MSQYTEVYCDQGARGKAGLCRNTTQPSHDTTLEPATQRLAPTTWPGATTTTRPQQPATRPRAHAWASLCALVGPGWLLCAPDSVFDPVFGLNTVSESLFGHCS